MKRSLVITVILTLLMIPALALGTAPQDDGIPTLSLGTAEIELQSTTVYSSYYFTAPEAGIYRFSSSSDGADPRLAMMDEDGTYTLIISDNELLCGEDFMLTCWMPAGKKVRLNVWQWYAGRWSMTISKMTPDVSLGTISPDAPYEFDLSSGGIAAGTLSGSGADWRFTFRVGGWEHNEWSFLFDEDGNRVIDDWATIPDGETWTLLLVNHNTDDQPAAKASNGSTARLRQPCLSAPIRSDAR